MGNQSTLNNKKLLIKKKSHLKYGVIFFIKSRIHFENLREKKKNK